MFRILPMPNGLVLLSLALVFPCFLTAEEPVDYQAIMKIRHEAFNNAQVMDILSHLTEEIGPRLTNSSGMRKAAIWTKEKFEAWQFSRVFLESYPFGDGWDFEYATLRMNAPRPMPLHILPRAWFPGTEGPVTADAVLAVLSNPVDYERFKGRLKGKIVFLDASRAYEHATKSATDLFDEEELAALCGFRYPSGRDWKAWLRKRIVRQMELNQFFQDEGVAAVVTISSRDNGIVRVMGNNNGSNPEQPRGVPSVVLAAEQYNHIVRLLESGKTVNLTLDVKAVFHTEDPMATNTIAELAGQGPNKDEIVLAGAHLDSWHGATGATDNGAGVAVVMEAMRILKATGLPLKRTVRVGLWSGEEQGLYGSRHHVFHHYAYHSPAETDDPIEKILPAVMRKEPGTLHLRPDHEKLSVHFNLDNGAGKIRGIWSEENLAAMPIFKAWLAPFADLGAETVTVRGSYGTDHSSFDQVGLPGFQFLQDPMDYNTHTHHTEIDVLDHVQANDLKQAAAIMASFLYHASIRDQPFPRKPMVRPFIQDKRQK